MRRVIVGELGCFSGEPRSADIRAIRYALVGTSAKRPATSAVGRVRRLRSTWLPISKVVAAQPWHLDDVGMIEGFSFEHFRAFIRPLKVRLRPITLLYGYNNSGKSALIRGASSLISSLKGQAGSPWTTDIALTRGAGFAELSSTPLTGKTAFFRCGLEFNQSEVAAADWTLRTDGKRSFVSDFSLISREQQKVSGTVAATQGPDKDFAWLYEVSAFGKTAQMKVIFEGLKPRLIGAESDGAKLIARLASALSAPSHTVQWLSASRHSPPRQHKPITTWTAPLGHDGSHVLDFLVSESEGSTLGPIGREVSLWFESNFRRRLRLEPMGDRYDLKIEPFGDVASDLSRGQVCLADAGEGLSQVLPVLVALERAKQGGAYASRLLCVEEPESHLHPRFHRGLAEAFCKAISGDNPPTIVAETHSENLLLRVQLAVARKEIPADRVAIYWVRQDEAGESSAELNILDAIGRPIGNWPPMVFGEDLRLSRELLQIQRAAEPIKNTEPYPKPKES